MATNREKFFKHFKLDPKQSLSLDEIARLSKMPREILLEVYRRGYAAATTNPESVRIKGTFAKNPDMKKYPRSARLSNEAWGYARVYAFTMGSTTFKTADADLAKGLKPVGK